MRLESLDRCVQQYTTHVRSKAFDPDPNEGWFPVATGDDGSVIVTDCRETNPDRAITTVVNSLGDLKEREYWLPSLTVPVSGWLDCFDSGEWVVDDTGAFRDLGFDSRSYTPQMSGLV